MAAVSRPISSEQPYPIRCAEAQRGRIRRDQRPSSAHRLAVSVTVAAFLIAHRLRWRARVDRLARRMGFPVVPREIVLRIEMGAADDAIVLVGVCHGASVMGFYPA
jgi:hypothetical protein